MSDRPKTAMEVVTGERELQSEAKLLSSDLAARARTYGAEFRDAPETPEISRSCAWFVGYRQALEDVEALICRHQLSFTESKVRPDIKQGHWIACANIRSGMHKNDSTTQGDK